MPAGVTEATFGTVVSSAKATVDSIDAAINGTAVYFPSREIKIPHTEMYGG